MLGRPCALPPLQPICIITDRKYMYDSATKDMGRWAVQGRQVSHPMWCADFHGAKTDACGNVQMTGVMQEDGRVQTPGDYTYNGAPGVLQSRVSMRLQGVQGAEVQG